MFAGLSCLAVGTAALAQDKPEPLSEKLAVGAKAPDFSLGGGTKDGVLSEPARLKDYRGQTVVLAFFYKARTKG